MENQIQQLLATLEAIENLSHPCAEEIGKQIGVSGRTIRSRIAFLKSLGAKISAKRIGNKWGYRLAESFQLGEALKQVALNLEENNRGKNNEKLES